MFLSKAFKFVVPVTLIVMVIVFVLLLLQNANPFEVEIYTIEPTTNINDVGEILLPTELDRITDMHITLLSDGSVRTSDWPHHGINIIEAQRTTGCLSRNCVTFSHSEGGSGLHSGVSITTIATMDLDYLSMSVLIDISNWKIIDGVNYSDGKSAIYRFKILHQ